MYVSALHSVRCRLPAWNPNTANTSASLTTVHCRKSIATLIASSACTDRVRRSRSCGSNGVALAIRTDLLEVLRVGDARRTGDAFLSTY